MLDIYVRQDKAHLSIYTQLEDGQFVHIEPVYDSGLRPEELSSTLSKLHKLEPVELPQAGCLKAVNDALLVHLQACNWKEMEREGTMCRIAWADDSIQLVITRRDKKGRWKFNSERSQVFALDHELDDIVAIILEDIRLHLDESASGTGSGSE
jgi:hypothetical protein